MTFDYFFSNPELIPKSLLWSIFSKEHLIWLFSIFIFILCMCRIFKKTDFNVQNKILKFFAVLIVIQEILKDIFHYIAGTFTLEHLPFHLCGISIFITFLYAFKPGKLNGEYLYALSLPGALAALIFPDWTNYPMFHFSNINSFTIHTWLVVFVAMLLYSGRLKPNYKELIHVGVFIGVLAVPIYFLNKLWSTNFMFLNIPAPVSPLEFLYTLCSCFGDNCMVFYVYTLVSEI